MTQGLRPLSFPLDNLDLIASTHKEIHNNLQLQFQGIPLASLGTRHTHSVQIYMQAKHSQK